MNKKEFEQLVREVRDDESQRHLRDRSVKYEDEPKDLRDVLEAKAQEQAKGEQDLGRER